MERCDICRKEMPQGGAVGSICYTCIKKAALKAHDEEEEKTSERRSLEELIEYFTQVLEFLKAIEEDGHYPRALMKTLAKDLEDIAESISEEKVILDKIKNEGRRYYENI